MQYCVHNKPQQNIKIKFQTLCVHNRLSGHKLQWVVTDTEWVQMVNETPAWHGCLGNTSGDQLNVASNWFYRKKAKSKLVDSNS